MITWRPRCSKEAAVPLSGQIVIKEAAVSTRGRLLHATTDWRLLCRPISSIPAVRQLSAGKSVGRSDSSSGLPKGGRNGGKLRQKRLRARNARGGQEKALHRKLCGEVHWGATYARRRKCENALELQGKRAPAKSPGQLIARESTLDKETALWARWGAHRERVEADA